MQISFLTFWWAHAKVSSSSSTKPEAKAKLAQTLFRFMRFDKLWLHLMCAYGVTCPFHVTPLASRAKKLDTLTQPRLCHCDCLLLATDTQFPVGISISVDMSSSFVGLTVGADVAGCHCLCLCLFFAHPRKTAHFRECHARVESFYFKLWQNHFGLSGVIALLVLATLVQLCN